LSKIAANATFNIINTVVTILSNIVISILLTRLLGPERFGEYSVLLLTIVTASTLISIGLDMSVRKYVAEFDGRDDLDAISGVIGFGLVLVYLLGLGLLIFALVTPSAVTLIFSLPKERVATILAFGGALISATLTIFQSALAGLQKYSRLAVVTSLTNVVSFVLIVLFLAMDYGIYAVILAMIIAFSAGIIVSWRFVLGEGVSIRLTLLHGDIGKRVIKYTLIAAGIAISNLVVWERAEVFFLAKFARSQDVAFYSLAFSLSTTILNFLPGAVAGVLMPMISQRRGASDEQDIDRLFVAGTRYIAMLSLPIGVGAGILAVPLVSLLYGPSYLPATRALQILLVGAVWGTIARASASVLYGTAHHGFLLKMGAAFAVVSVVLDIVLIPQFGVLGAAVANSTVQIMESILVKYYVCRTRNVPYPIKDVFRAAAASAGMALLIVPLSFALDGYINIFISVALGSISYFALLILLRFFDARDIELLLSFSHPMPAWAKDKYLTLVKSFPTRKI
jgi:O-antigen/teichoic acid export membrane protein